MIVEPAKTIRLDQLDAELGNPGLSMKVTDGVAEVWGPDDLDDETLAAAIAAHTPEPLPASDAEKIAELVDATSVLTDLVFSLMEG